MTMKIVIELKIVDIDKQQRQLVAVFSALFKLLSEVVVEKPVIIKPGQSVYIGQVV